MYSLKIKYGIPVEELDFVEMKKCFMDQDMPLEGSNTKVCEI
jgi:hypothetical protein